ncbi:Yop proteins translocation protein L [bacterium BMS3Abin05]|nr:Yop proteins translocation protein L [bacterium BMS3Abin05]
MSLSKSYSGHILKNTKIKTDQFPFECFDPEEEDILNNFQPGENLSAPKDKPGSEGWRADLLNAGESGFLQNGVNLNEFVPKDDVGHREKEAYQKGFHQGRDEGIRMGKEAVQPFMQTLQAILREWEEKREQLFKENEIVIVQLAFEIAKKVIHQEISSNPDLMLYVVREALKRVSGSRNLIIKLNPEDVAVLERGKKSDLPELEQFEKIQLVPEKNVERGGCILESDSGIVDAQLDVQLKKIEESLLEESHEE